MASEYISNRRATNRQGWISFVGFYARRARRIVPTAFIVIGLTILIGKILNFDSGTGKNLYLDATWGVFFLSNLNYMNASTEYFGQATQQSPLLHYWSLSVEEQFYLIWPVLFLTITSTRGFKWLGLVFNWRRRLIWSLVAISIMSLTTYFVQLQEGSASSYFSSLGRFWEFAIGAFFGLYSGNKFRKFHRFANYLLFIVCIFAFLIFDTRAFRYFLIVPVLVTGLSLYHAVNSGEIGLVSRIMNSKFFNYFGSVSFSLYLVHWPIIVFVSAKGFEVSGPNLLWIIPLVLLISAIIHKEVELRFLKIPIPEVSKRSAARRTRYFPLNQDALKYGSLLIFLSIVALNLQSGANRPFIIDKFQPKVVTPWKAPQGPFMPSPQSRMFPEEVLSTENNFNQSWISKISEGLKLGSVPEGLQSKIKNLDSDRVSTWNACLTILSDNPACNYGNATASKKIYVLGDSYALSITPMVAEAFKGQDVYILTRNRAQCMVPDVETINLGKIDKDCNNHRKRVNEEIMKENPFLVVVSSLNSNLIVGDKVTLINGMNKSFRFLIENAQHVVVIGETPFTKDPRSCAEADGSLAGCIGSANNRLEYRNLTKSSALDAGAVYTDLTPWMCLSGKCPVIIDQTIVSWDGGHITAEFSRKLAPLFKSSLKTAGVVGSG